MRSLLLLLLLIGPLVRAQTDSARLKVEILDFQHELNEEYKDPKRSPLDAGQLQEFAGHIFYGIDLRFRVIAKLKITDQSPFLPMKTTSSRLKNHRVFGIAEFDLNGKHFSLPVYQSQDLLANPQYKDYLFLPFTDLTNNEGTYGGGRYLDLKIPADEEFIIDFNKAYNPFCAYSNRYACPIVPAENHLPVAITAGTRFEGH